AASWACGGSAPTRSLRSSARGSTAACAIRRLSGAPGRRRIHQGGQLFHRHRKDGHPGRRTVTYKATRDERFPVASERRNDAVLAEGVDDADGKRPGLEMRVQIASGRERPEPRNIQALRIRLVIEEGLLDVGVQTP